MRAAIQPQKRRSTFTPKSDSRTFAAKLASLRIRSTPRSGTSISTPRSAMIVARRPASPKVRIRSELENMSAMNEIPAVPCVSTQAGPTTSTAFRNA